jgi:release factor glutamine methyltransferase
MTVAGLLNWAEHKLIKSLSPRLDAEVILAFILKKDRPWLMTHDADQVPWRNQLRYRRLIYLRQQGTPVAYLTHRKDFYGRTFYVNRHVLIPRPETELLIQQAYWLIRANTQITTCVDIGTGSGCLAVTLTKEFPHLNIIATDISSTALRVAQKNARQHGVADKIIFYRGNLLEPVKAYLSPNALIVANLPYLTPHDIQGELKYEPHGALYGGENGLHYYRKLLHQITALPPQQRPLTWLLELHPPTAKQAADAITQALPAARVNILNDISQRPRLAHLTLA